MNHLEIATFQGKEWVLTPWQQGKRFGINPVEGMRVFDTRTTLSNFRALLITPPPLAEPKEFGAMVEAGNAKHPEHDRKLWVNTKGVNGWTNGYSNNVYSDLINPKLVSK